MRIRARFAVLFAVLAAFVTAVAGPALAQNVPPGQSCGGLLCDMGVFGHKVPVGPNGEALPPQQTAVAIAAAEAADPHRLPCHDFLCRAFGQKDADAAPPPPPPVAAAEPEPTPPTKAAKKKKRHVAKSDATSALAAK